MIIAVQRTLSENTTKVQYV